MSTSRDDFAIAIRSALLQRGARQKFSLFFLICFSILIFFLDSFPSKFMDGLRATLNDGIYRVSSVSTSPIKFVSIINDKIKKHISIYNENELLKSEVEALRNKNFNVEFLTNENKKLQQIVESEVSENENAILAKVLLDKKSPFLKSIIVNKGSKSGVKKGMPVIEQSYLVGRVVETNFFSSRILLLNDLNSRIPVVVEGSNAQAILMGTGENFPILEYLPEFFKPNQNETVFTSGKDGIFPAGLPVGNILESEKLTYVKLFSDSSQLSFVNIILVEPNKRMDF